MGTGDGECYIKIYPDAVQKAQKARENAVKKAKQKALQKQNARENNARAERENLMQRQKDARARAEVTQQKAKEKQKEREKEFGADDELSVAVAISELGSNNVRGWEHRSEAEQEEFRTVLGDEIERRATLVGGCLGSRTRRVTTDTR